jgi:hypothetical protein
LMKFSYNIFRIHVIFITLPTNLLIKPLTAWKSYVNFCYPFFYIGLGSGIRDPGSGMNKYSDPGSGIKHPGSATLLDTVPLTTVFIWSVIAKSQTIYRTRFLLSISGRKPNDQILLVKYDKNKFSFS